LAQYFDFQLARGLQQAVLQQCMSVAASSAYMFMTLTVYDPDATFACLHMHVCAFLLPRVLLLGTGCAPEDGTGAS
jgi:hypothetical protein